MLEHMTAASFDERVGEAFRVRAGDSTLELKLLIVTEATVRPDDAPRARPPFSILFGGPLHPVLPQATYAFENDVLGEFELFIVPVGPEAGEMQYEAVFG